MFIKKDLRKIPTILADAAASTRGDEDDAEMIDTTMAGAAESKKKLLTDLPLQRKYYCFTASCYF